MLREQTHSTSRSRRVSKPTAWTVLFLLSIGCFISACAGNDVQLDFIPTTAPAAVAQEGFQDADEPPDAGGAAAAAAAAARPNFLYILSDDLGYGEISIMPDRPNRNISTPNIDHLFMEGMRFTDFYGNKDCAPSRASLMTGKHTGHSTIRVNVGHAWLRKDDITFFEILRDAGGYVVSCVGKWHVSGHANSPEGKYKSNPEGAPWNKGCSSFYGADNSGKLYPKDHVYRWRPESGLTEEMYPQNADATRSKCMLPGNDCVWLADLNLEESLSELEYHKARQDAEAAAGLVPTPFFLYVAWSEPHEGTWSSASDIRGNPVPSNKDLAHEMTWNDYEKDHAACIQSYHDKYVAIVLARLDELGLRNDTVVIYASDNGSQEFMGGTFPGADDAHRGTFFASNGRLRGWKEHLNEGGIRVPFSIRWPGKIAAGTVCNEPLAIWDHFPTILGIAGVPETEWPADIDGVSFWKGILQQKPEPSAASDVVKPYANWTHPALYFEACEGEKRYRPQYTWARGGSNFMRAIRHQRWKGIQYFTEGEFSGFHLHDMWNDIGETKDESRSHPQIAQFLKDLMNSPGMRTSEAGGFNYSFGNDEVCAGYYGYAIEASILT